MATKKKQSATTTLKTNEAKWGKALMGAGWCAVPNVIIERQKAIGLDAIDMNILLHLMRYWWTADKLPRPSKSTIAAAIGCTPRTVQRRIAEMEKGKLIKRIPQHGSDNSRKTNLYSFEGLIEAATPFAQEHIEKVETRKAQDKSTVSKKGRATNKKH